MNIRDVFSYATEPHRICTCGYQADGSFIAECANDRAWRKAQPVDPGSARPGNGGMFGRQPFTLDERRAQLEDAEKHLGDLLSWRTIARHMGAMPRELSHDLHVVRQKIQRLRKQIAAAEALQPIGENACRVS